MAISYATSPRDRYGSGPYLTYSVDVSSNVCRSCRHFIFMKPGTDSQFYEKLILKGPNIIKDMIWQNDEFGEV